MILRSTQLHTRWSVKCISQKGQGVGFDVKLVLLDWYNKRQSTYVHNSPFLDTILVTDHVVDILINLTPHRAPIGISGNFRPANLFPAIRAAHHRAREGEVST